MVAILATYNEERFISGCLKHLIDHGVGVFVIDNCSTDETLKIVESYQNQGVIGIESFPRTHGVYRWRDILQRKEQLAMEIEADWFMHMDADEVRLPPNSGETLVEAFAEVDRKGFNAVNFLEFTFVPTREAPDHEHGNYEQTMQSYYPFVRNFPFQIKAWKKQRSQVSLADSGGHRVLFPDLRVYPESFKMRHYIFLSATHALRKYHARVYDAGEIKEGWHGWRAKLHAEKIELPSKGKLNVYTTDDELDISNPRTTHISENWAL